MKPPMSRLAIALLAFATLTTGCAAMGTKRGTGAQIQRTAEPAPSLDQSPLDARPELGQR
jgi:predicted small secreted protein